MLYKILLIITVYAGNLNGGVGVTTYEPKTIFFNLEDCKKVSEQFNLTLTNKNTSEVQRTHVVPICYGIKSSNYYK